MGEGTQHSAGRGTAITVLHQTTSASRKPRTETSHTEHVLIFLQEGSLRMHSGAPVHVESGAIMIVPAGTPHRHLSGSTRKWAVGFCASCLGLDETQPLMQPFQSVRLGAMPVVPIISSRRSRVALLFSELHEECDRAAPESRELTRSLLLLLLGEVRRAMPESDINAPVGSLLGGALEFIQRHALEPVSLRDVAAAVSRTPAHVAATIKNATGYSVGEWLRAARVTEAAAWLAHSDETLDDITVRVGWQDKTHLIRQFRKTYGKTPAAWRRTFRAGNASK